jgi:hypothetical protein
MKLRTEKKSIKPKPGSLYEHAIPASTSHRHWLVYNSWEVHEALYPAKPWFVQKAGQGVKRLFSSLRFNDICLAEFWTYLGPITPFSWLFPLLEWKCLPCAQPIIV